jgi:hypothetical protein
MNPEIGMLLFGYCDGYFGRDSYDTKRIEAFGVDWIVARQDTNGVVDFCTFDSLAERNGFVAKHSSAKAKEEWEHRGS